MLVERIIDGDVAVVRIDNEPPSKPQADILGRRIMLAYAVRVHSRRIDIFAANIANKLARKPAQNRCGNKSIPKPHLLFQAICDEFGAIAMGRTLKYKSDAGIDYGSADKDYITFFFEDDDAAMMMKMKMG